MELKYCKPVLWTSQGNFPTGSRSLPFRCIQEILANPEIFMNYCLIIFSSTGGENRLTDNSGEVLTFHEMWKVTEHSFVRL